MGNRSSSLDGVDSGDTRRDNTNMGIRSSSLDGVDSGDTRRPYTEYGAFENNKKYNILAPISKESNGYLKSNRISGADVLLANGMGGSDDQNSSWIAKRNPIGTTIYWKIWTFDSTNEIVVTANNKIELQPVSSSTPDEGNLFLPTSLRKRESYYQYHLLQPKSMESEHKYLGVNRDGSMTLVTNIDRNPALNPNPQAAFMVFKVED